MKTYKAYMFRGKDPAIADVKAIVGAASYKSVEDSGGPSASTLRAWFNGKTRQPKNATIEAAGRAMGYRREWVKGK